MSNVLTILGGLGVFLFGLRIMSGGLQKMAGGRLRAILAGLTRNRLAGVFSGFLITCAVQSSSATTVLVVSFANAGLLTLAQAIGLVMGANIGTTLTAWLVSLFGFKIEIAAFALPIIGVGFPLSLIKSNRAKQLSEVMVGFGLLFLGLAFLKDGVPDLKSNPDALSFVQSIAGYGFSSRILFVVIGTVLTIVVQSSSASTAITLTLVAKGWIELDLAAAMVLGENIGTTITAQLASIGANRNARRVATFHTVFNLIGVCWMLPAAPWVLAIIQGVIPGSAETSQLAATTQVALFHTSFNVTNTFLLMWFVPQLQSMVLWLVPRRDGEHEGAHLRYLEAGLLETPELALVEARRGVQDMVGVCGTMFGKLREVLENPDKKLGNLVSEIRRQEQKTDEMEEEIIEFCAALSHHETTTGAMRTIARYLEMANDIERIGDHCLNLLLLAERRFDKGYRFNQDTQAQLEEMLSAVENFLKVTHRAMDGDKGKTAIADAKVLEQRINKLRTRSRKSHAERMQEGQVNVGVGLVFLDMMTNMEKIGDYCWNVCALQEYGN